MLLNGVKMPLIRRNIIMKNRNAKIACCALDEILEIISPNAINAVR